MLPSRCWSRRLCSCASSPRARWHGRSTPFGPHAFGVGDRRVADIDGPPSAGPRRSSEGLRSRLHEELEPGRARRSALGQHSPVLTALRTRTYLSSQRLPAGWQLSAELVPASGIVAADCYDVSCVGAAMTVLLVDAAEQGVAAAAAGLRAKDLVRVALRTHDDPGDAMGGARGHARRRSTRAHRLPRQGRLHDRGGHLCKPRATPPRFCVTVVPSLAETGPGSVPETPRGRRPRSPCSPARIMVAYTDGLLTGRSDSASESTRNAGRDRPRQLRRHVRRDRQGSAH